MFLRTIETNKTVTMKGADLEEQSGFSDIKSEHQLLSATRSHRWLRRWWIVNLQPKNVGISECENASMRRRGRKTQQPLCHSYERTALCMVTAPQRVQNTFRFIVQRHLLTVEWKEKIILGRMLTAVDNQPGELHMDEYELYQLSGKRGENFKGPICIFKMYLNTTVSGLY